MSANTCYGNSIYRLYSSRSLFSHLFVNFTPFTSQRPPNLHGGIGLCMVIDPYLQYFTFKFLQGSYNRPSGGVQILTTPASYLYMIM